MLFDLVWRNDVYWNKVKAKTIDTTVEIGSLGLVEQRLSISYAIFIGFEIIHYMPILLEDISAPKCDKLSACFLLLWKAEYMDEGGTCRTKNSSCYWEVFLKLIRSK